MTATARIRQADITRTVAACVKGGMTVGTVRVSPDGTIEVYAGDGPHKAPRVNPLDELLAK